MIGVLALQGNFAMHLACLAKLGVAGIEVRDPTALSSLQGLIIPGGESSVMLKFLLSDDAWLPNLQHFFQDKKPIFGTCAGVILLAKHVVPEQESLGFLDVDVARNAYGRQVDSHNVAVTLDLGGVISEAMISFIRAPKITRVGARVKVLARVQQLPVIVEEAHVLGATCHPEASTTLVHDYFVKKCFARKN